MRLRSTNIRESHFSPGHNTSLPRIRIHGDVAVVTGDRMLEKRYSGYDGGVNFQYFEV